MTEGSFVLLMVTLCYKRHYMYFLFNDKYGCATYQLMVKMAISPLTLLKPSLNINHILNFKNFGFGKKTVNSCVKKQ